ncbi:DMT family transporter [Clostridium sp. P21]|uniref:DMT family transporter n=1 Tax=Clostridium muellerianum TaxID=2716538 RepID=A0A7Y0EG00_9CLOT|nr:DMT family transporter [Clostridium muellerianum]NMM62801.1 DMT family transporter [Clostridium muellerianum]
MKQGYISIILATVLFSSMEVALKLVSGQFNPIQLTFLRFLIGAIILLPIALKSLKSRKILLDKNDFKIFALEGFICVVVSMTFYQLAVLYSKASIVAVLFSCNPIFVIPFAYFMINEKICKTTIISLIISISAIVIIMNPFHMTNNIYGILFTILSAITFALYGVVGKKYSKKYGGVVQSCFCFFMGSAEMLLLILISKIHLVSQIIGKSKFKVFADIPIVQGITLSSIPGLIFVGIFVTGLGYTFYFLAMEKTSAATASLVFYIKPALAPVLALVILKEVINLNTIVGIILIIISSSITFVSNKNRTKIKSVEIDEELV